jgi:hypothetical protein
MACHAAAGISANLASRRPNDKVLNQSKRIEEEFVPASMPRSRQVATVDGDLDICCLAQKAALPLSNPAGPKVLYSVVQAPPERVPVDLRLEPQPDRV